MFQPKFEIRASLRYIVTQVNQKKRAKNTLTSVGLSVRQLESKPFLPSPFVQQEGTKDSLDKLVYGIEICKPL